MEGSEEEEEVGGQEGEGERGEGECIGGRERERARRRKGLLEEGERMQ